MFVVPHRRGAGALLRRSMLSAPLPSAYVLPAPLRRFAGICSALSAPLRRFGRGPRSQKKFARDPLPPLTPLCCCPSACFLLRSDMLSVSVLPAPFRHAVRQRFSRSAATLRNRVHPSDKFGLNPVPPLSPLRCCSSASSRSAAALLSVSVFPAPLRRFGTGFIPQTNSV